MIGKKLSKNWKITKIKCSFITSVLVLVLYGSHIYGQDIDGYLAKKVGSKSNIPQRHYGITITPENKIITSNLFGLAVFDGVRWKREVIKNGGEHLNYLYRFRTDKYSKRNYIVASLKALGFINFQKNQAKFKSIADKVMMDSILGSYVKRIVQANKKTYFINTTCSPPSIL